MTEAIWNALSENDKKAKLREYLQTLRDIDCGKHPLQGSPAAGSLPTVKKDLEEIIMNIFAWEKKGLRNRELPLGAVTSVE